MIALTATSFILSLIATFIAGIVFVFCVFKLYESREDVDTQLIDNPFLDGLEGFGSYSKQLILDIEQSLDSQIESIDVSSENSEELYDFLISAKEKVLPNLINLYKTILINNEQELIEDRTGRHPEEVLNLALLSLKDSINDTLKGEPLSFSKYPMTHSIVDIQRVQEFIDSRFKR